MRITCEALTKATILPALTLMLATGGCETKAGTGAIIGGLGGAAIGGIIGNNTGSGHTAGGALIGGAVGAIGGAVVGNEMDKRDNEDRYTKNYDDNFDEYGRRKR